MIRDTLGHIHTDIAEQRANILQKKQEIEEIQEQIKTWELRQITEIADALDEKGKPLFSNETKRQAELERRKQESEHYGQLKAKFKKLKYEHDTQIIILQCLIDKQENMRALARLEGVA